MRQLISFWKQLPFLFEDKEWRSPMEKNRKSKVRFIVVREFSGEKTIREAFEQLIERQTLEHFEEWLEQREAAEKAA